MRRWHQVGFWGPKGGVGTTTIALNAAAAACEHGLTVVYAELDHRIGDAAVFFEAGSDAPPVTGCGRVLAHPCGLRAICGPGASAAAGLRAELGDGHDLVVIDLPSAVPPPPDIADVVLMVVGLDLLSLRRARASLAESRPEPGATELICAGRDGSLVTVADCEAVLSLECRAIFPWDPDLAAAGDRGAFSYGLRHSSWAAVLRDLAGALCRGARPAGDSP